VQHSAADEGGPTLFPWYAATILAIESNGVIALRLLKIAGGGREARDEADLMVSEKIDALFEAGGSLCGAASAAMVISRYREHVAANAERLSLC